MIRKNESENKQFFRFFKKMLLIAQKCWHFGKIIRIHKSSPIFNEISHFSRNWRVKQKHVIPTLPPAFLLLRFLPPSLCPLAPGAPPSPPLSSLERISPSSRRLRPPPPPLPFLLAGVSSITCKNNYFWSILESFLEHFSFFLISSLIFLPWFFRTKFEPKSYRTIAARHATTLANHIPYR